jgi:hypothetical protein
VILQSTEGKASTDEFYGRHKISQLEAIQGKTIRVVVDENDTFTSKD